MLEHLKWLGLHNDVGAGSRFFWFTSTAWMVWNAAVSALLTGATVVLYDGSPTWPNRATCCGASPPPPAPPTSAPAPATSPPASAPGYSPAATTTCRNCAACCPRDRRCRSWPAMGHEHVKPDVWLDAPSGGTDVCTPYAAAARFLRCTPARLECRFLGTRVEAWREDGTPVLDEIAELVVTAAMPSMPVTFFERPRRRALPPGLLRDLPRRLAPRRPDHADSRGTAIVHGRSDSTINRHGVRLGSADIYSVVEQIPEIADCLVIGAELDGGSYWMPLFVTLADGAVLDAELTDRVKAAIRSGCSTRHVPDEIIEVPAIPHTMTGKRLEVPVKRLLQGFPVERAVNPGAVDRPDVLAHFVALGAQRRGDGGEPR